MKIKYLTLVGAAFALTISSSAAVAQSTSESSEIKLSPEGLEILCERFPLNSRCQGNATTPAGVVPTEPGPETPPADPAIDRTVAPETIDDPVDADLTPSNVPGTMSPDGTMNMPGGTMAPDGSTPPAGTVPDGAVDSPSPDEVESRPSQDGSISPESTTTPDTDTGTTTDDTDVPVDGIDNEPTGGGTRDSIPATTPQ